MQEEKITGKTEPQNHPVVERPFRVYVASSWRNQDQPLVIRALQAAGGFEAYDFRNPDPTNHGFHWSEIDRDWQCWTTKKFFAALAHPIAIDGFKRDMAALEGADACILVMPCGRSAHLEIGYAIGAGKLAIIYMPYQTGTYEPELMYKMAGHITDDLSEIIEILENFKNVPR